MDFLHKSIIAVVALAIVGGAGWFTYDLYIRPKRALALEERRIKDAAERKAAEAAIDHSLAAFDATAMQAQKAAPAQARELWMAFLKNYPGSSKAAAAQAALGPLNAADLFSPSPSPNKVVHTVAKGDSLYKISRANGTSVELIARANNLPGIMLQIGQQLVVPKTDIKATVDRALDLADRMRWSLNLMSGIALFAGLVVLFSIAHRQAELRRWDMNLCRVLGGSSEGVRAQTLVEFGLLGGAASAFGALLSLVFAWITAYFLFDGTFVAAGPPLAATIVGGTLLTLAVAWLGAGSLWRRNPAELLQE